MLQHLQHGLPGKLYLIWAVITLWVCAVLMSVAFLCAQHLLSCRQLRSNFIAAGGLN
jgi:hypothetical protein